MKPLEKYDHEEYNHLRYESRKALSNDYSDLKGRRDRMKFHADLVAISNSMRETKEKYKQGGKNTLAEFISDITFCFDMENETAKKAGEQFLSFEFYFHENYPLINDDSPNIETFNKLFHQAYVVFHSFIDCYHFKERLEALKIMTKESIKVFNSEYYDYINESFEALQRFYWAHFEVSARHSSVSSLCDLLDRRGYDSEVTADDIEETGGKPKNAGDRIKRVREIYREVPARTIQEALEIFHKEVDEVIYTSETSFHNSERNWRKRQQTKRIL